MVSWAVTTTHNPPVNWTHRQTDRQTDRQDYEPFMKATVSWTVTTTHNSPVQWTHRLRQTVKQRQTGLWAFYEGHGKLNSYDNTQPNCTLDTQTQTDSETETDRIMSHGKLNSYDNIQPTCKLDTHTDRQTDSETDRQDYEPFMKATVSWTVTTTHNSPVQWTHRLRQTVKQRQTGLWAFYEGHGKLNRYDNTQTHL